MALMEAVFAGVAVAATGTSTLTYQGRHLDLSPPFRRARLVDLVSDAVDEDVSVATSPARLAEIADARGVDIEESWGPGRVTGPLARRTKPSQRAPGPPQGSYAPGGNGVSSTPDIGLYIRYT